MLHVTCASGVGAGTPSVSTKGQKKNIGGDIKKMNVNPADISIAHRIGRKPDDRDKRHIFFKLCRRDWMGDIFEAFKVIKPPFYINTSSTHLINEILYGLRFL